MIPKGETTLTVLGCGTLGKAILRGILTKKHEETDSLPPGAPKRFIACVTRTESVNAVKEELGSLTSNLTVLKNENVRAVREADVILLGCKPYSVSSILSGPEMREALQGKLLLSILAGVPSKQIEDVLDVHSWSNPCQVIRIMPNTAAGVGESMTVVEKPDPPLPDATRELVLWIFRCVGQVAELPPQLFDACTALCGAGPAFFSLVAEAMADGAVAMGIPRAEAQRMTAQAMRGTAALILGGEHPARLRDKVATPGGCTIGGLLVLEEGRVRGNVARAVREATTVASQLGKGVQGVNGTRF